MPKMAPAARAERRQQIIDAAWRCAARKGFSDLTVDEVCAEAGLSKGAFYGYFDSKQALLVALLEEDAGALDDLSEDLEGAEISDVERLRRFMRATVERGEHPGQVQLRADLWAGMLTDEVVRSRFSEAIARRRKRLKVWIDRAVASGELSEVPSNALASILLALSDGLTLHAGLDPSGFRWPNVRRALDALLEGISRA
ncbi:MAG TPA: TetR/AcrR family transcriptional regulator [Actinomycetota bacterium]|jgi:AcrR family transcriptional regulator